MKTVNGLFEKIIDKDNIRLALYNASKSRRKQRTVRRALIGEDATVERVYQELSTMTWQPPEYRRITVINDGIQAKKREIVCPSFVREHIVHHAILQVCKPIFIRRFYKHSYSSIPVYGGTENMIKYIRHILYKGKYQDVKYFVKLDIKKFFDSVKPDTVMAVLRSIIRDKRVLELFSRILRSNKGISVDGEIKLKGIPIGLYTSQWFANLVLTPLDDLIKAGNKAVVPYYIRYNDDMLLIGPNKRKLLVVVQQIVQYLRGIGLRLKNEVQIHQTSKNKINFVGTQIDFVKKIVKMHGRTFLKMRRFFLRTIRAMGVCPLVIREVRKALVYLGRARHYDMYTFVKFMCEHKQEFRKFVSRYDKRRNKLNGSSLGAVAL